MFNNASLKPHHYLRPMDECIENASEIGAKTRELSELNGCFKAKDVLKLAGLTYRQLNDWDVRAGILHADRKTSAGWRQFTLEQVAALAISTNLRATFSISLDQAGKTYEWLVGKQPDREQITQAAAAELNLERYTPIVIVNGYQSADIDEQKHGALLELTRAYARNNSWRPTFVALKMVQLNLPAYLVTDMSAFSILGQDELAKWISVRTDPKPTIIFPLNDVLNKILKAKNIPKYSLDRFFKSFRDYWNRLQDHAELTPSEREVLRLINERRYQRITAHIRDGRIVRVERDEDLSINDDDAEEAILEALRSGHHQRITVQKTDGKIVWIGRKQSIRLDRVTEKR